MFQLDDNIVAVSSPAGVSARAIVRLSGPDALKLADSVFLGASGPLSASSGFRCFDGRAVITVGGIELPARAYVFRAPRSYTRQDVVEFHIPGSPTAATAMVSALLSAGAREAQGGEFTARAFFSGRIDLSAAEAVADMIDAADQVRLRSASAALGGWLGRLCRRAAVTLTDALATVEASIDLAEENIALEPPGRLARRLDCVARRLLRQAQRAGELPETADRPRVVIAGRPNVGKSSLLNVLSGTDRAIVSAVAGTTRDVLTAAISFPNGSTAILQDAAGLASPNDPLAAAADQAARAAVAVADVIVFVVDLSAADFQTDVEFLRQARRANHRCPCLVVGNKADLLDSQAAAAALAGLSSLLETAGIGSPRQPLIVSATVGGGLDDLRRAIADCLHRSTDRPGVAMGLHQRQRRCLQAAASAARRAAELLAPAGDISDVAELAAVELRAAMDELGHISGQVVTEDVLGRIFSRFCVGK